jgi:hypothetical protein
LRVTNPFGRLAFLIRRLRRPFEVFSRGLIEPFGFSTRDTQAFPLRPREVLGQVHDLSNMVGIMSQLTIDRLKHAQLLTANHHRALQLRRSKRRETAEKQKPSFIPTGEQTVTRFVR